MQILKGSLIALAVAAATSQMAVASQQSETKGFVDGSKLKVLNRSMWMQKDFKNGDGDTTAGLPGDGDDWGYGLITTFSSGFTQGPVGFGVDAFGLVGLKLDHSGLDGATGVLEVKDDGETRDDFSVAGAAIKAQFSNTVIKYGNQMPALPVFAMSDSRLLPESATGTLITSNEIDGLTLNAGRFTEIRNRNESRSDSKGLTSINLIGGKYAFTKELSASVYYGDTDNYWRKYYGNVNYVLPLADTQSLVFDFNMYDQKGDSDVAARDAIDNQTYSLAAAYKFGAHTLTLSHQRMTGDSGYSYGVDGGSSMYTAHSVQISDFNQEDERSWGLRYDLNMASFGVPGLTFMTRYIRGDNFNDAAGNSSTEWERDVEAKYTLQNGPAKDLSARLRWGARRSDTLSDQEDIRVIVEYPLSIL